MKAEFLPIGFDRTKCLHWLEAAGIDGVLLTSPESIFYVTGYPSVPSSGNPILFAIRNHYPFYAFINKAGRIFLIAWEYSLLDITLGADHIITHKNSDQALQGLADLLKREMGAGKHLGIESSCPYQLSTFVQACISPSQFSVIDQAIDQFRLIKSDEEINRLRKSCEIAERTFVNLVPIIKPGLMRGDLIQEAKQRMISNGASGIGHCTISFGASNPEVEINETLESDRLVIVDLGAMYYGYASDIRRMLYTGKIPDKMQELHHTMCAIVDTIGNALAPGIIVQKLCSLAEKLYLDAGLLPNFTHLGHTIGLNTEEVWLDRTNTMQLEPGMVVNIELYSMLPSGENIGDEETYIITETQSICLNSLPKPIQQITF